MAAQAEAINSVVKLFFVIRVNFPFEIGCSRSGATGIPVYAREARFITLESQKKNWQIPAQK